MNQINSLTIELKVLHSKYELLEESIIVKVENLEKLFASLQIENMKSIYDIKQLENKIKSVNEEKDLLNDKLEHLEDNSNSLNKNTHTNMKNQLVLKLNLLVMCAIQHSQKT